MTCTAQELCEHILSRAGLSCWVDFSSEEGEGAGAVSLRGEAGEQH